MALHNIYIQIQMQYEICELYHNLQFFSIVYKKTDA